TDHEMPAIVSAVAKAGAKTASYVPLRLPFGVAPLFEEWLTINRPLQKEKILGRIREIRGGRTNDPNFGSCMHGEGPYAQHLAELFQISCRKVGLSTIRPKLSAASFRPPGGSQISLFS